MSRIGKRPVAIPGGVTANIADGTLSVKGPKGTLTLSLADDVSYKLEDGSISVQPANDTKRARAFWGMQRTLVQNYSHDVNFPVPEGIEIKAPDNTTIEITGIDKQRGGQVAAEIRRWRKPEPYKGKGIRYRGEYIFRKEGKKK